jgi:hypothetical protein
VAIPCYNDALVSISKLLHEIIDIKFLPQEERNVMLELRRSMEAAAAAAAAVNENNSNSSNSENNTQELINRAKQRKFPDTFYSLDLFLAKASEMNRRTDETLDYFFAYVKYVVDHTRQRMFDKLRFYEILVHQVSPSEVAKSIHMQHKIQAEREAELAATQKQIGLLGNFVELVSVYLGSNLLKVARAEVKRFVDEVCKCTEEKRDPIFVAELGFNKMGKLRILFYF